MVEDDNKVGESAPTKLTEWVKEPTVQDLKQDLVDSRTYHSTQVSKVDGYLDNLNITGKAKPVTPKGNSAIQPKLIRKQAEWRYSSLSEPFLSSDDLFDVQPITWEDKEAARQNSILLNNQFNTKINKVNFIDEYVRTAVDEGTVIVQVGWEFEEEEVIEQAPIVEFQVNPEFAQIIEEAYQLSIESPSQYQTDIPDELKEAVRMSMEMQQPIEPVVVGTQEVKVIKAVKNCPTVEICDHRNVIIDPTCKGDLSKARFIIYSFETSIAELRKEGKYKNLEHINIDANSILGDPDHTVKEGIDFNFSDKLRKKIVCYEYWGYREIDDSGLVKPIVATWVGDTMIRMEENPMPDKKLPFVSVQYLPVRKNVYGEPDGVLIEDNQKIAGAVSRGMIDILGKSANGQTGTIKGLLDVTNKRKFEKGLDYEFNSGVDPRQGIYMHTYPEIPASAQFMLQLQNMEAESITGVKAFNQGISGEAFGKVATGARGAMDAASKRESGILRRLANGIIEIGRKFIAMNAVYLSDEEVVRITNEEFVKIRKDDLPGNFDLRLTISTAEADNAKAEELAFMLQTTGNNMGPEIYTMILAEIAKLRKMPKLAKQIESYRPEPDPLQQRKAELEIALLEAQVATEQAKAQELMSKVGVNQNKAINLQSDTDLKSLDFVEQESGVKQERELEKQGAQARANMELKKLDNELKNKSEMQKNLKEYLKNI